MKKKEKINFVINTLEELYPNPPIPLKHSNPYTLLIAVLLSAQCTDKRVNKITPILFKECTTPEQMLKRTQEEILSIVRPCGLGPMKSKGIYELTRMIINEHNGKVPQSFEALEKFPAVGHKTASVVMSQAFGVPSFPVDTHIQRLMYRWGFCKKNTVVATEREAKKIFPIEKWNTLHLQIIYYGREYCPARKHEVSQCLICSKI